MKKEQFLVALAICMVTVAICAVALTSTYVWTELKDTTGRYQISGATVIDTTSGTIYATQGAFRERQRQRSEFEPSGAIRARPLRPYFYCGLGCLTGPGYEPAETWR